MMINSKPSVENANPMKPRYPRMFMIAVFIVPILILLFHRHLAALPPSFYLRPCGRVVLVSAARHGSTWFTTCAEGCPTRGEPHFGSANGKTELWVNRNGRGVVEDVTPEEAVDYVRNNMSLKIMPLTTVREEELQKFFGLLHRSVPVFVLKRNLEDSYASLLEAKETRVWMRNRVKEEDRIRDRKIVKDEKFFGYQAKVEQHFAKVERFMREKDVLWDEIDYEEAAGSRIIVGEKQGCYITNCNYL